VSSEIIYPLVGKSKEFGDDDGYIIAVSRSGIVDIPWNLVGTSTQRIPSKE
jgi:hypothetical protein